MYDVLQEYSTVIIAIITIVVFWIFKTNIRDFLVEISMTKYRWITVILLVLPLSFVYNIFDTLRNKFIFWLQSSPQNHEKRVAKISKDIKEWRKSNPNKPMCTARSSWLTTNLFHPSYKKTMKGIELNLRDVLEVDTKNNLVRVEPLVTCGQLTSTLLPLGYTIPVIPELDDLTVGGLLMGFGIETSSHRHGLFQSLVVEYEVVLADGSVVKCTKESDPELFYSLPWSYGTLGFLLSATLKMCKAKKYVHISYFPCHTKKEFIDLFSKHSLKEKDDFIEALCYSDSEAVVMITNMTDDYESGKLNQIGKFYKPWFYKHVESFLKKGKYDEYIPLREYYHRHTKSLFWEMEDILPFGNHPLFRYTLGWLVPPKVSFLKLTTTSRVQEVYFSKHVDQDLLVPLTSLSESLTKLDEVWKVYPLWICPMKLYKTEVDGIINPTGDKDEMFVDIGIYGVPKSTRFNHVRSCKEAEKFVRWVKGFQALYAVTYQEKEEFRQMFNHTVYDKLRVKYNCKGAFPTIFEKVNRKVRGVPSQ